MQQQKTRADISQNRSPGPLEPACSITPFRFEFLMAVALGKYAAAKFAGIVSSRKSRQRVAYKNPRCYTFIIKYV